MPRKPTTYQFDLFSRLNDTDMMMEAPRWQALPVETRRSVTKLMVRPILDHVGGDRAGDRHRGLLHERAQVHHVVGHRGTVRNSVREAGFVTGRRTFRRRRRRTGSWPRTTRAAVVSIPRPRG
ncbi:hypothetical protein EN844_26070 [Mesorhizobium sp. M3A.F.Ca.ET.201.01.1.1]|nr:hypothetical protein EN844_26070 [Mesorhizobium sp. M3A.F.Ca.ET.201.01.1.1]